MTLDAAPIVAFRPEIEAGGTAMILVTETTRGVGGSPPRRELIYINPAFITAIRDYQDGCVVTMASEEYTIRLEDNAGHLVTRIDDWRNGGTGFGR